MEPYERTTCSFVVKIWAADAEDDVQGRTWRGRVTHIPSGDQHYFVELDRLKEVLIPYFDAMDLDPDQTAVVCAVP